MESDEDSRSMDRQRQQPQRYQAYSDRPGDDNHHQSSSLPDVENDVPLDMTSLSGGFGRFHKRYAFTVMGVIWFFCGAHTILMSFITQEPPRFPLCGLGIGRLLQDDQSISDGIPTFSPHIFPDNLKDSLNAGDDVNQFPAPPSASFYSGDDGQSGSNDGTTDDSEDDMDESQQAPMSSRPMSSVFDVSTTTTTTTTAMQHQDPSLSLSDNHPPFFNQFIPFADRSNRLCDPLIPLTSDDCTTPYFYYHPTATVVSEFYIPHAKCASRMGLFSGVAWTSSAFFVGFLLGVALLGRLGDIAGRRKGVVTSVIVMEIAALLSGMTGSLYQYGLMRLFVGFGVGGAGLLTFITLAEVTNQTYRPIITLFHAVSFALGGCFTCLLATVVPNWRLLIMSVALPGLVTLTVICSQWSIESPRWLAAKGFGDRALTTWKFIAESNGRQLPNEVTGESLVHTARFEVAADDERTVETTFELPEGGSDDDPDDEENGKKKKSTPKGKSSAMSPTKIRRLSSERTSDGLDGGTPRGGDGSSSDSGEGVTTRSNELLDHSRGLNAGKEGLRDAFRISPMKMWTPVLLWLWFSASLTYYGVYFDEASILNSTPLSDSSPWMKIAGFIHPLSPIDTSNETVIVDALQGVPSNGTISEIPPQFDRMNAVDESSVPPQPVPEFRRRLQESDRPLFDQPGAQSNTGSFESAQQEQPPSVDAAPPSANGFPSDISEKNAQESSAGAEVPHRDEERPASGQFEFPKIGPTSRNTEQEPDVAGIRTTTTSTVTTTSTTTTSTTTTSTTTTSGTTTTTTSTTPTTTSTLSTTTTNEMVFRDTVAVDNEAAVLVGHTKSLDLKTTEIGVVENVDVDDGFLHRVGGFVNHGVENVRHYIEEKNLSQTMNVMGEELGKGFHQVQQELDEMDLEELLYGNTTAGTRWEQAKERMFYNFIERDPTALFWQQSRQLGLTTFMTFLMEVPIACLTVFLAGCHCVGRRGVILSSFFIGSLLCFSAFIVQMTAKDRNTLVFYVPLLANLGRLSISGTFLLLYLYSSEVYPTSIRASVVGILSTAARVAGIVAPLLVNNVEPILPGGPLIAFGVVCLVSSIISCRVLPETLGRPLVDTVATLRMAHHFAPSPRSKRRGFFRRRRNSETLQLTSIA